VKAQEQYQQNADHNRAEALDLQIGDWVYIKAKYFQTGCPSKKNSWKRTWDPSRS